MKADLTYLKSMAGDDESIIREMIIIFNDQVIEFKEVMTNALLQKDWDTLSKIAHKAKSSVRVMGLNELADLMKNLESMASKSENIMEYPSMVDIFLKGCQEATTELNSMYVN